MKLRVKKLVILCIALLTLSSMVFLVPIGSACALEARVAEVLSHSSYMWYKKYKELYTGRVYEGDFFHVVGEVQNVIAENIELEEIVPVFYDEKGVVIYAEPLETSIEPLRILTPGQKSPFEIIILDEFKSNEVANYELSVEATVTTEEAYRLGIPDHNSYLSYGWFDVVGEVENVGAENKQHNIGSVVILATFYDREGTVIGADFSYANIDILVPGQKSPFSISNYPREEITTNIGSYGLCSKTAGAFYKVPYRELQIVTHKPEISLGDYTVSGEVKNVGETDTTFVKVIATFYDSNGRIVGCDYTYTDPIDLKTGQTGSFEVVLRNTELSIKVVSYALQFECSEYEVLPIIFELSNLEIKPLEAKVGEEVEITFNVTNVGERSGIDTMGLTVEGEGTKYRDAKLITLDVGETRSVTFNLTRKDAGTYTAIVACSECNADLEDTFTVEKEGGCIIATSTYGSELTPEVQFLRDFRDNMVLTTFAGSNFLEVFNGFYYSWSPSVASKISGNNGLRGIMKILLYPLIGILHVSSISYSVFSFNPELGVITAGLVASALIGIVYFLPLALIVSFIRKVRISSKIIRTTGVIWLGSVIAVLVSEIVRLDLLMKLSSSTFVLVTITITLLTSLKVALQYEEIKRAR